MIHAIYSIFIYPIILVMDFSFFLSIKIFKDPGICLITASLIISIISLPLYLAAEKFQQKERDLKNSLKPKIDNIKTVFKGDERYMILSTFYRQNHYHPVYALRSSLGLLLQIPFFIAAYHYISHLDLINGTSFLFVKDLGSPDKLLFSANVLPVIMTALNCIAALIYSKGFPAKEKIQLFGVSFVFLFLLYNSPAALVIYWSLNNIISILKNLYLKSGWKFRKHFLFSLFSLLFIFLTGYINYNNIAGEKLRFLLSFIFFLFACFPWFISAINGPLSRFVDTFIPDKNKTLIFLLTIALIALVTGALAPSALISSSPQEFSYIDGFSSPFPFIAAAFLQALGIFFLWPLFFYFLGAGQTKKYFAFFGLFLVAIIILDYFAFPGNYGYISINMVFDKGTSHAANEILFNLFSVFAVILLVLLPGIFRKQNYIVPVLAFLIFAAAGISVYNCNVIRHEYNKTRDSISRSLLPSFGSVDKIKPIFTLSRQGKNVIVIMADRANNSFVPFIFNEKPELFDSYSGFVYYPNTLSFGENTNSASSALFGGYEYTPAEMNKRPGKNFLEKHNEALLLMPLIFSRNDFAVTVADQPYPNAQLFFDTGLYKPYPGVTTLPTTGIYKDLWLKENNFSLPKISDRLNRNILLYGIFRCSPLLLRPYIYYNGDWCSLVSIDDLLTLLDSYSVLDYLPQLTFIDPGEDNNLMILGNKTPHEAALLQAPDYVPAENVNITGMGPYKSEPVYHVNAATLARLGEYFDFLKQEGVYDNTRIILVADHGHNNNIVGKHHTGIPVNLDAVNPLLLVKDFNDRWKLKTDNSFMTNADVPFIATRDIISSPVNPFTGNPLSVDAKEEPLYIAVSLDSHFSGLVPVLPLDPKKDYYIKDDIFVPSNWVKADTAAKP